MEKDGARTLTRAFDLLDIVASRAPIPLRLSELAIAADLHKATAHRLLASLVAGQFLEMTTGGYAIGPRCWALGFAAARRFDLAHIAKASLQRIAMATSDVAYFSVRIGTHIRCIAREEGDYPILPTTVKVGLTQPLGCGALAVAVLAALPEQESHHAVVATETERRDIQGFEDNDVLLRRVEHVRRLGYAPDHGGVRLGMAGIALAVYDPWEGVIGAIGFGAIEERLKPERYPEILAHLRNEKASIESSIAGSYPNLASRRRAPRKSVG